MQHWGMDVSTRRLAVAIVDADGWEDVDTLEYGKTEPGAQRLSRIFHTTAAYVGRLAVDHPPVCVWVEQPTGRHPAPTLVHAVGVVMAATYSALSELYPFPVSVLGIGVSEWKAVTVGRGNASKQDIAAWAAGIGYDGTSQDEADAIGIALGGLALMGDLNAYA